jgi:hypothetical protein
MKCFLYHKKNKRKCENKTCRYWLDHKQGLNCCIIMSESPDKITLESIGNIFNVTRMRICQLEKLAIKKIKEKIKRP